ncbi:MAG: hypothetical protein H6767_00485 [Candidatus Peribacteria bacterium]|nr:MAG: hypothetical protein H6767_00485 [Candidatus Peribacteria bacterium]
MDTCPDGDLSPSYYDRTCIAPEDMTSNDDAEQAETDTSDLVAPLTSQVVHEVSRLLPTKTPSKRYSDEPLLFSDDVEDMTEVSDAITTRDDVNENTKTKDV